MIVKTGDQIANGFFAVASVDTDTGQIELSSQLLGDPGGPFKIIVTPATTEAALMTLAYAVLAVIPPH